MIPCFQRITRKRLLSCVRTPVQYGKRMGSSSQPVSKIKLQNSSLKGVHSFNPNPWTVLGSDLPKCQRKWLSSDLPPTLQSDINVASDTHNLLKNKVDRSPLYRIPCEFDYLIREHKLMRVTPTEVVSTQICTRLAESMVLQPHWFGPVSKVHVLSKHALQRETIALHDTMISDSNQRMHTGCTPQQRQLRTIYHQLGDMRYRHQ